jgi:hypothetical protein
LNAAGVVVLVDAGALGRAGQDALTERLRAGGGVLLAAGDPLLAGHLSGVQLPALGLPAPAEPRVGGGDGVPARIVDPTHPLFAGLDETARRTVEDIRWRRWFAFAADGSRVVLELAGGEPLLLEREVGDGRLAVLATHFTTEAGGLSRSPMALPMMQRLVSWLGNGAGRDGAAEVLVGHDLRVRPRAGAPAAALADASALLVTGPLAGSARSADLDWRGTTPVLGAGPADRAGFAAFMAGPDTLGLVAIAVPAAETIEPRDGARGWRARLADLDLEVAADLSGADPTRLTGALSGRNLAPWAFLLAVALLAAEMAVGAGTGRRGGAGS